MVTVFVHRDFVPLDGLQLPTLKTGLPDEVPGAVAGAVSTGARAEYEVNALSVIWLAMTCSATGFILFEILFGYSHAGFSEVLSQLTTGQPLPDTVFVLLPHV